MIGISYANQLEEPVQNHSCLKYHLEKWKLLPVTADFIYYGTYASQVSYRAGFLNQR